MDLKTARIWQDVLLWGGAVVSLVGAWGFQNTVTALVGLMMMGASLIVWWRFYRCPKCGEHLHVFGESKLPEVAAHYGLPVLGTLPIDPAIAAACDAGTFEDDLPEGLLPDAVALALDLPELEVSEQEPQGPEPTMAERAAAAAAAYKAKKAADDAAATSADTVDVTPREV